jgi:hypothetical protein
MNEPYTIVHIAIPKKSILEENKEEMLVTCTSNQTPPTEQDISITRGCKSLLTLENRAFIHLVKVFFCTSLCSSAGGRRDRDR